MIEKQTPVDLSAPPRPIAKGALLVALLRVATLLSSAVVTVVVARVLGPTGSGTFAVAAALFLALSTFSTLGIDVGVAWMAAGRRWPFPSAFRTSQAAALALGLAAAALGLVLYRLLRTSVFERLDVEAAVAVAAAVPFALASAFAAQLALAVDRYEAAVAIPGAQAVVYLAAVATLTASFGIEGALVGLLVSQLAGFATAAAWRLRAEKTLARGDAARIDLTRLKVAAGFGAKAYLANALALLHYRFDLFLLAAFKGEAEVGYYAVAVAATNAVWLVPSALSSVLFPRVSSLSSAQQPREARDVETRTFRHTTILLLVAAILFAVAVPVLIEPIFGSAFAPAVTPALVLLPGGVALGVASVFFAALAGRGRPDYALRSALVMTPAAILLYFLLVPSYGATGAALASSVSYGGSAALAVLFTRRLTGEPVMHRLVPRRDQLADYRAFVAGFSLRRRRRLV